MHPPHHPFTHGCGPLQVLEAARPYLTGNPEADQDILRFYVAKQQLLSKLQAGG